MVKEGSVQRVPGSLEMRFIVTDFQHEVPVRLSRRAAGPVQGELRRRRPWPPGCQLACSIADEVLAKHDENYMPPAVGKVAEEGRVRDAIRAAPAAQ